MESIKIKSVCSYNGHSLKANGNVNFSLKAKYDQLVNTIGLTQLLNNDVNIVVKRPDQKPNKLGSFRINGIKIDHDGESVISLNSMNDFVEVDELNSIVTTDPFQVMFSAEIELEEGDEDAED